MPQFTPGSALAGGALIGLASAALLVFRGKIAGISGILDGALRRDGEGWRVAFLAGMILAGAAATLVMPSRFGAPAGGALWTVAGGLITGAGVQLGNGCTSGHGICGIGRLSRRSIVAVAIFMATGIATATLVRVLS